MKGKRTNNARLETLRQLTRKMNYDGAFKIITQLIELTNRWWVKMYVVQVKHIVIVRQNSIRSVSNDYVK